jgi:hypothetical protein
VANFGLSINEMCECQGTPNESYSGFEIKVIATARHARGEGHHKVFLGGLAGKVEK